MASAVSNALGVTIFPVREGEDKDGFDLFFDSFPEAIAAQLEVKQGEDDVSADWYLLVPRESGGGFKWIPVETYGKEEERTLAVVPITRGK